MRWLIDYLKALLIGTSTSGPTSAKKNQPKPPETKDGMTEGDMHSGPGGYEGGSYSGGYAADYRDGEN